MPRRRCVENVAQLGMNRNVNIAAGLLLPEYDSAVLDVLRAEVDNV